MNNQKFHYFTSEPTYTARDWLNGSLLLRLKLTLNLNVPNADKLVPYFQIHLQGWTEQTERDQLRLNVTKEKREVETTRWSVHLTLWDLIIQSNQITKSAKFDLSGRGCISVCLASFRPFV